MTSESSRSATVSDRPRRTRTRLAVWLLLVEVPNPAYICGDELCPYLARFRSMNTTPVSLLQRLRQPTAHHAWSRFVELYTPLMFAWARRCGLNESDAADLVQDAFTHLLTKLPEFQYDPARSFRAWLRTVLVNQWRDRQRRGQQALPLAGSAALSALAESDPVAEFDAAEFRQHLVARAMQLMQADFQPASWKACWEVVVNDRVPAEVAAELGLTVGAVHAARFRILTRLRQELEGMID